MGTDNKNPQLGSQDGARIGSQDGSKIAPKQDLKMPPKEDLKIAPKQDLKMAPEFGEHHAGTQSVCSKQPSVAARQNAAPATTY